jgi:hypothetical protein
MEWTSLPDSTLARWQRMSRVDSRGAPEAKTSSRNDAISAAAATTSNSIGRWLWALVLLLLTAESVLRRNLRTPPVR